MDEGIAHSSPIDDERIDLAVVGAHLSGFPLNHDLVKLDAILQTRTTTSPRYRLYELQNTAPPKPGFVRAPDHGACIDIEVWSIPSNAVGRFLTTIPSPLGLGSIELSNGRWVTGFICEPYGLHDAKDITQYGGWRTYTERS
ncbi:hypothetical protein QM012_007616 [Aureobasidium pullulans]|uniref:Allophanate hydrolase C-terminal domain-containing protein n=1 Tax=Aureobasidium pullulans TaxID=5580 RepID=A0ABR0TL12_AURPU